MENNIALIVAAGRGRRFGGDLPKQYHMLGGKMVLRRTILSLLGHERVQSVQVVIHPDDLPLYEQATVGLDLLPVVFGGETRQISVLNGLNAISAHSPDGVLIHDAARPFVTPQAIERALAAVENKRGAILAMPVVDTLKKGKDGLSIDTVDRNSLWRAQTPQVFNFDEILQAHQSVTDEDLTDDAAVFEKWGGDVVLVEGNEENFKITAFEDLERAEKVLAMDIEFRTGSGFDVHAFEEGDCVTLCGVEIPHTAKLKGHSDADVALHALTDAVLGSIGAGDIGMHFPPSDPQWAGAASDQFLTHACKLLREASGALVNVDLTIICERPKIGAHRDKMIERLSEILQLEKSRISVKGTTTEKLGFTGRQEGIAAQAVVSVKIQP